MIGYVRGKVSHIFSGACFVDVNGVGYRVYISANTRDALQEGEETTLFTYMSVREDAMQLYGFATQDEYDLFTLLISVSGIGPKVGLGVLSGMSADAIKVAIMNGEVKTLTKLPGIGKKSAERLVLELKDKIAKLGPVVMTSEKGGFDFDATPTRTGVAGEVAEALISLGYNETEFSDILHRVDDGSLNESALLRAVLSELGKGK